MKKCAKITQEITESLEEKKDNKNYCADKRLNKNAQFKPGDRLWVTTHRISKSKRSVTRKLMPKR